jgi:hypothetical protein
LKGFDLIKSRDIVDDRVNPSSLNISDVSGIDLTADIVDISFVDLFFS